MAADATCNDDAEDDNPDDLVKNARSYPELPLITADKSGLGMWGGNDVCKKLLDDGTLLRVDGYENDFENVPALDVIEADLGIRVLIFVVWIMLLHLVAEADETLVDFATEYGLEVCEIVFGRW